MEVKGQTMNLLDGLLAYRELKIAHMEGPVVESEDAIEKTKTELRNLLQHSDLDKARRQQG